MDESRRLSIWLRFAGALALAFCLSGAATAATTGNGLPVREPLAVAHLSATAASTSTAVLHSGNALRHAVVKHRLPATASGVAVAALALFGIAFVAVRRRRTDPAVRHHLLSLGARAPPLVSGI